MGIQVGEGLAGCMAAEYKRRARVVRMRGRGRHLMGSACALLLLSLDCRKGNSELWAGAAAYQTPGTVTSVAASSVASGSPLSSPARGWAVDVAANELLALHHPGSYLRYRMHVRDEKGDVVRDVIESKDGSVARLILKNGRPLDAEEDRGEQERLNGMIASPSDYFRHVKNEESGRKLADSMIRSMPDAMIYTYTPGQPQTGSNGGAQEIVLDYEPDPRWKPPTTTSAALTGLRGRMWVDAKTRQLVRMEGTIFRGVNFGYGMLAHIYPGGKLVLEQTNAGGRRWIFRHFNQEVTVRALMVKMLRVSMDVDAEGFEVLPAMGYQDAIRMLQKAPLPK